MPHNSTKLNENQFNMSEVPMEPEGWWFDSCLLQPAFWSALGQDTEQRVEGVSKMCVNATVKSGWQEKHNIYTVHLVFE